MGKIKNLPLAGPLTGNEWAEIEQNGGPKRLLLSNFPGGGGGGVGMRNIDGGFPGTVYLTTQSIEGGHPSSTYLSTQFYNAGNP